MDQQGNQAVRLIIAWSTILDVSPTSDATTIKKAYYKKSKSGPYRHTDKGGDKDMFQTLNNAHDGLQSADMHLRQAASQQMANNRARPPFEEWRRWQEEDDERQRQHEQEELQRRQQEDRDAQIRRQQEQRARDQAHRADEELRRRQREEHEQQQQQQQRQQQDRRRPEEQQEAEDAAAADKEATSRGKEAYTSCVKNSKEAYTSCVKNAKKVIPYVRDAKKFVFERTNDLLVFLCFLTLFMRIILAKIGHKGVQKYHACRTLVEEVYCDRSNKNMWTMIYYSCVRSWNGHTGDHDTCNCPMCCWERQARFDCGCRAKEFIYLTPCQCHCCQNNKGFPSFVKGYAGLDETYNREEL